MDPSMRLFEYNEKSLLASIPTMLAFPKVRGSDCSGLCSRNYYSCLFLASRLLSGGRKDKC